MPVDNVTMKAGADNAVKPEAVSADLCFASPILWYRIPDSEELNAALLRDSEALRSASQGVTVSNRLGWHSETDLFRRSEASFNKLCRALEECLLASTKKCAPNFDIFGMEMETSGWININPKHGYNNPHRHSGFVWSGTYYVQIPQTTDEDSGAIVFSDPRGLDVVNRIKGSDMFAENLRFNPKPGTLVIFPSYLLHWVTPNQESQDRVSIAFNARFHKKQFRPANPAPISGIFGAGTFSQGRTSKQK